MLTPLLNNQREVVDTAGGGGVSIDPVRVTEVTQEVEWSGTATYVTEVTQEIEWVAPETRATEVTQEVENEHFPDLVATETHQAAEWDRNDIVVTATQQASEWERPDLIVTSVMQMVEYLSVPTPPTPPGEEADCPPFRIFWQDSNVRVHSWKDGGASAYHVIRPFGGPHQVDGAKI